MSQQNPKPQSRALVAGTVTFYLVAALAMVMANKWVLNVTKAPLFFLFTQLFIAVALFSASHSLGVITIPMKYDLPLLKALFPMIALNVVGLSASNYTLKYVDASFYQVARGLVLPFTVLTSGYFLHSRPSLAILFSCGVVTLGFFTGVFFDGVSASPLGIFFGVGSSMITALHAVVIKRALEIVGGSALNLSWYTNLLSAAVVLVLAFIVGEGSAIAKIIAGEGGEGEIATFLWGSAITGVFGFAMSLASLLSIKVTSPITHMVSSAVRGVAATFLGMWLFHDVISFGRATSIAIILIGSVYYTYVKHLESQKSGPSDPIVKRQDGAEYERVPLEEIESGDMTERRGGEDRPGLHERRSE